MGGLRSGQYAKAVFEKRRAMCCVGFLFAAVLVGGCGGNGGTASQVEPTLSATVSPTAAPANPSPTAEPPTGTPTSTSEPTALPPPTQPPAPTPDTRVPIRDLPTPDQVQLGKDGKYFVADRGDGCTWVEYLRDTSPEIGLQVFLRTDCAVDFGITFRPESGEVLRLS